MSQSHSSSSDNCDKCAMNTLEMTRLQNKLKELELCYNSLANAYDDKCAQLSELQESLNQLTAIFSIASTEQTEHTEDTEHSADTERKEQLEHHHTHRHHAASCLKVNRIFQYLIQYKNEGVQFGRVYRGKITYILNDYHHLLEIHQYKEIYSLLPKDLKCNISKCKIMNKTNKINEINDIMDMIHIYICHSYHIYSMNKHDLITKIRPFNRYTYDCNMYYFDKKKVKSKTKTKIKIKRKIKIKIKGKAKSLKHEIKDYYLSISVEEYNFIYRIAKQLIKTDICRKMNGFQLENIIVIMMYCRYDKLCYDFCKTFENIEMNASNFKMNNKYFWMSKILRETVECYGGNISVSDTLIRGVTDNSLLIDLCVGGVSFVGPISTSTSLDVAAIFAANNGFVLEFSQYKLSPNIKCFGCEWISQYGAEKEMLLFGNNQSNTYYLQIINIRLLKMNENIDCKSYIQAIRNFDCFLRGGGDGDGDGADNDSDDNINDEMTINGLIDEYLGIQSNKYPQYINNMFSAFCKQFVSIYISIDDMSFVSIFWSEIDHLLRFDKMMKIFPNCIVIKMTVNVVNGDEYNIIDKQYLNSLLIIIKSINEISVHEISIYLERVKCEYDFLAANVIDKCREIGWKLNIDRDALGLQNLSFTKNKQNQSVIDKLTKLQLV